MKGVKKLYMVVALVIAVGMAFTACGANNEAVQQSETKAVTQGATQSETSKPETTKPETTKPETTKPDTSKEVNLRMYLLGDKPADTDLVYAEVNKKLKQDINATLEVNFLSWAEFKTKYPLIFASGEDFDLVFAADWVFYMQQAAKDAFLALTEDMLKKYAPKTYSEVPKAAWKQAEIDGKVFMVPYTNKTYMSNVAIIRGDLRQKYNLPEIKSVDDIEKYLDTVAKNEKDIIPWADLNANTCFRLQYLLSSFPNSYIGVGGGAIAGNYIGYDDSCKINSILNEDYYNQMLELFKKINEWYKKGFWSKSAVTAKGGAADQFKAGKGAFMADNYTNIQKTVDEINKVHPEWKPEIYDLNFSKYAFVNSYLSNGMSIHAASKNPERSLMLLDLFRNDQSYFDLTTYGIKGKHYDLASDGKVTVGPDASNYPADTACPWGWRTDLFRTSSTTAPELVSINDSFNKRAYSPVMTGFSFNNENTKNEYAAMKSVDDQYLPIFQLGVEDNVEARMKEYFEKLKAAGLEKYMSEINKQVDEYKKSLGY